MTWTLLLHVVAKIADILLHTFSSSKGGSILSFDDVDHSLGVHLSVPQEEQKSATETLAAAVAEQLEQVTAATTALQSQAPEAAPEPSTSEGPSAVSYGEAHSAQNGQSYVPEASGQVGIAAGSPWRKFAREQSSCMQVILAMLSPA